MKLLMISFLLLSTTLFASVGNSCSGKYENDALILNLQVNRSSGLNESGGWSNARLVGKLEGKEGHNITGGELLFNGEKYLFKPEATINIKGYEEPYRVTFQYSDDETPYRVILEMTNSDYGSHALEIKVLQEGKKERSIWKLIFLFLILFGGLGHLVNLLKHYHKRLVLDTIRPPEGWD